MVNDTERLNCLLADIIPRYLGELQTCKEDFPKHGRIIYSSGSMFIQYLLPTLTISIAYWQIYGQLRMRLNQKMNQLNLTLSPTTEHQEADDNHIRSSVAFTNKINRGTCTVAHVILRMEQDISRMRRTIHLLISIGMVFCICWLPLNILNVVSYMNAVSAMHE